MILDAALPRPAERPVRSLAKATTWRIIASLDTVLLAWWFTGEVETALAIGLTEVLTKLVIYYIHERAWNRSRLGRQTRGDFE